jgi:hypothetical protein
MKNLKKAIALLLITGTAYASTPVEVMVPIDHVYSPKGFDSNDNTEVIVSGYLPNLCHKNPTTKVEVNAKGIDIKVTSLKYDPSNPFCPEMIVPFVETVNVGILDKGNYDIVVNGKSIYEKRSEIFISESNSDAVDEYAYAGVQFIEKSAGSRVVQLKGYNPSDCFVLDQIEIINNEKDTYSVLPRMKQISDFCPMKMVPFTYEMTVPKDLKADRVLLHVRSMDGKSVNTLFYNVAFE